MFGLFNKKSAPAAAPDPNDPVAMAGIDVPHARRADGVWVIHGNVDLANRNLTVLPDLSNVEVEGNFDCSFNYLGSLNGAPKKISGNFDCRGNELHSIKGGPAEVGGEYNAVGNYYTDLEGMPQKAGSLVTDAGNFASPADVPPTLRSKEDADAYVDAYIEMLQNRISNVALDAPVRIGRPLALAPKK